MVRPINKSYTFSWRSEMENKIDVEFSIPQDAKQSVKDFIVEKLDDIKNFTGDLLDFPVTDVIEIYWPVIVEIIKGLGLG